MDEMPIDATVGVAHNNNNTNSIHNNYQSKNSITPNGSAISKLNSGRNSSKSLFNANERNNSANDMSSGQLSASQLSPTTFATAAAALATAAAASDISVNQLISQVYQINIKFKYLSLFYQIFVCLIKV
jgi:predicted HicB family RNase H-like nuclease